MRNGWWIILLTLALTWGVPRESKAQAKPGEQEPPLRTTTELIEVRAVVTDRQGQPVDHLKQEDFEVLENGRPREISFFSVTRLAGKDDQPSALDQAAASTSRTLPSSSPARTVALFVDTLHLSPSSLLYIKRALRRYVDEQLSDQDLVALITTTGSLGLVEQFTRDRRILRYAIEKLRPRPSPQSLFTPFLAAQVSRGDRDALRVANTILWAEEKMPTTRGLAEDRSKQILLEAGYQTRATLLSLKAVGERLAGMPGQRLIVLFSDGFSLWDTGGHANTGDLQAVTSRAARSGVVIYAIDAKGLRPPMFDASWGGVGSDDRLMNYVQASVRDEENGLNALAKDTGGEAFFNTNDLSGALRRALDDNRLYYTLAYYPATEDEKKPFRPITVRVKNHPEYKVRAQKGYLTTELARGKKEEPAPTPPQRLLQAIVAPLPVTTLGMTVSADYLETEVDEAQVTLRVHLDGGQLDYRQQDGRYLFGLELVTLVFDGTGQRAGNQSEMIEGNLPPERLALGRQNGLHCSKRLPLKPGLYQVRVGARELNTDRVGTAWAWVEVPNLARAKLALSSILLLDSPPVDWQAATLTSENDPVQSRVVQGIRLYRKNEPLLYLVRVYGDLTKVHPGAELLMQTEIVQGEKQVSQGTWKPVSARLIGRDKKGIALGEQLKASNLAPGLYELRITVKDPASNRVAHQAVVFGVEP